MQFRNSSKVKEALSSLLVTVMMLVLVACGNEDKNPNPNPTTPSAPQQGGGSAPGVTPSDSQQPESTPVRPGVQPVPPGGLATTVLNPVPVDGQPATRNPPIAANPMQPRNPVVVPPGPAAVPPGPAAVPPGPAAVPPGPAAVPPGPAYAPISDERVVVDLPYPIPSSRVIRPALPARPLLNSNAYGLDVETGHYETRTDGDVIAIGDVHGDLKAARQALMLAGVLVGPEPHWDARTNRWVRLDEIHWNPDARGVVVVQVGDKLDREKDDRWIIEWFDRLALEAANHGSRFLDLLGNHEFMNAQLDFHDVTPEAFFAFADLTRLPGQFPFSFFELFLETQWKLYGHGYDDITPGEKILRGSDEVGAIHTEVAEHNETIAVVAPDLEQLRDDIRDGFGGGTATPAERNAQADRYQRMLDTARARLRELEPTILPRIRADLNPVLGEEIVTWTPRALTRADRRPDPVAGRRLPVMLTPQQRGALLQRAYAFAPGGDWVRQFIAPHPLYTIVNDTVFVHGGLSRGMIRCEFLPDDFRSQLAVLAPGRSDLSRQCLRYLNLTFQAWMNGGTGLTDETVRGSLSGRAAFTQYIPGFGLRPFAQEHAQMAIRVNGGYYLQSVLDQILADSTDGHETLSPVWLRRFSNAVADDRVPVAERPVHGQAAAVAACAEINEVLGALGVNRMVVGHTPRARNGSRRPPIELITGCEGKFFVVDVALSAGMRGENNAGASPFEVLKIGRDGRAEVLRNPRLSSRRR